MSDDLEAARGLLARAQSVAFFTGAGASQESGIDTFRDDGGFWDRYPLDDFATLTGLLKTGTTAPERVADFLIDVFEPVAQAAPNPGHRAVAALQPHKDVAVITQNVDGLHQAAGSTTVYEIHGSLFSVVDDAGHVVRRLQRPDLQRLVARLRRARTRRFKLLRLLRAVWPILSLTPTGRLRRRPSVVLFGEGLREPDWTLARHAVHDADVLVVVGTSGEVAPANQLPLLARSERTPVIGIGLEPGPFDIWLQGRSAKWLPALVENA